MSPTADKPGNGRPPVSPKCHNKLYIIDRQQTETLKSEMKKTEEIHERPLQARKSLIQFLFLEILDDLV